MTERFARRCAIVTGASRGHRQGPGDGIALSGQVSAAAARRRATDHPPRPVTEPDSSIPELEERSPAYLRLLLCLLLPAAMFNAY